MDQGWAQRTTGLALALLALSWLPIGYVETSLLWLLAGVIALTLRTGRSCSSQSPDHCRQACSGKPPGWGWHVFSFAGAATGHRCHTALFPLGWQAVGLAGAAVSACISDLVGSRRLRHSFACFSGPVKKTVTMT